MKVALLYYLHASPMKGFSHNILHIDESFLLEFRPVFEKLHVSSKS